MLDMEKKGKKEKRKMTNNKKLHVNTIKMTNIRQIKINYINKEYNYITCLNHLLFFLRAQFKTNLLLKKLFKIQP